MMHRKKLCVIATGGTIASVQGHEGLHPGISGYELLKSVPGATELAALDCVDLMALDSSNLLPEHWIKMAKAVAERRELYDGFIILHGTDTMAYSAGALFLMLENIDRPVIFTGSQLPMAASGTDAVGNILSAIYGALSGRMGVFLAFDGKLYSGGDVMKLYSRSFAGFGSINGTPLAVFNNKEMKWVWQRNPAKPNGAFRLVTQLDDSVVVLKLTPGISPFLLRLIVDAGYHAVIIEGYGAGGVPGTDSPKNFLPALSYAAERGTLIVCITQCIYDGTYLDTYEVGRAALDMGAVSGRRLHLELLLPAIMLALGKSRERASLDERIRELDARIM